MPIIIFLLNASLTIAQLVNDPSFELGSWSGIYDCCNANQGEPQIDGGQTKDSYEGVYALKLKANNHCACVHQQIELPDKGCDYRLSFYYKGSKPAYCVIDLEKPGGSSSAGNCVPFKTLPGTSEWKREDIGLNDLKSIDLHLYANAENELITNYYDDFSIYCKDDSSFNEMASHADEKECSTDLECIQPIEKKETKKCSIDNNFVIIEQEKNISRCNTKTFTCYESTQYSERTIKNCASFNTYCFEGDCGCPEGYKACLAAGKCVKLNVKDSGEYYGCEFECKSNLGKNGQCIDPITIRLSTSKEKLKIGQSTDVSVSLDNALDYSIEANILISLGNGLSISTSFASQSCSQNICKLFEKIEAKQLKHLSLSVDCADTINKTPVSAKITYTAGDFSTTSEKVIEITCLANESQKGGFFSSLLAFLRSVFS